MSALKINVLWNKPYLHVEKWLGWSYTRGDTISSIEALRAITPTIGLDVSNCLAEGRVNYRGEAGQSMHESSFSFLASPHLLAVFVDVKDEARVEFNDWYDNEHIPRLSQVDGVHAAVRFHRIEGPRSIFDSKDERATQYLAIYGISDHRIIDSPAWVAAANTEWTVRLRPFFLRSDRYLMRKDLNTV